MFSVGMAIAIQTDLTRSNPNPNSCVSHLVTHYKSWSKTLYSRPNVDRIIVTGEAGAASESTHLIL